MSQPEKNKRIDEIIYALAELTEPQLADVLTHVQRVRAAPICDCGKPSKLMTGGTLFPGRRDVADKAYWRCESCDAHVGCHPGTSTPMGSLAGPALRKARRDAHQAFDGIWRARIGQSRQSAYAWLAGQMGLGLDECHIALFNEEQCRQVVELCATRAKESA